MTPVPPQQSAVERTDDLYPILISDVRKMIQAIRQLGGTELCIGIPWGLIAPHEKQAQANHGQTLKGLASRGGLSACEALAIIEDRRWHRMDDADANRRLGNRIRVYKNALAEAARTTLSEAKTHG